MYSRPGTFWSAASVLMPPYWCLSSLKRVQVTPPSSERYTPHTPLITPATYTEAEYLAPAGALPSAIELAPYTSGWKIDCPQIGAAAASLVQVAPESSECRMLLPSVTQTSPSTFGLTAIDVAPKSAVHELAAKVLLSVKVWPPSVEV